MLNLLKNIISTALVLGNNNQNPFQFVRKLFDFISKFIKQGKNFSES